ncbi:MAG: hypothetical protein WAV22_00235 [Porticoccaceae bacterium]
MSALQRHVRKFLAFVISSCTIGLPGTGHALHGVEQFTSTPEAPEAYQAFTLRVTVPCGTTDLEPAAVTVDVSASSIAIVAWWADFTCPINEKIGNVMGLPGGIYQVERRSPDDGHLGAVYGNVTVSPAPPTQPVFAFYNSDIRHYFITAGVSEKDSLLGGGGGGGWAMVDEGFKAWPADGPAPAAAKPVCRFYSSLVNSHFYTAGANECELLKQPGSGWTYEGIAFRALVPTQGSCYPGTTPVWRLYNDRFAQADSNHRFIAGADTYRHMIANGWVGEGVAFCSPES